MRLLVRLIVIIDRVGRRAYVSLIFGVWTDDWRCPDHGLRVMCGVELVQLLLVSGGEALCCDLCCAPAIDNVLLATGHHIAARILKTTGFTLTIGGLVRYRRLVSSLLF